MDEEAVRTFVEQAQETLDVSPQMDEEATKFRLVLPFIELLGWNPRSTDVEPEHTVRMATSTTKVDFALLLGDTPVMFVEAKPARSDLDDDSVEQLRSYMRQELQVDWGVVTNGKSFEVLTKGDDGREGEISLIQFDLDDLEERPDVLEILSKESIRSGKSGEIATQIARAGQAIEHLREHRERVVGNLNELLLDEIGDTVPLDTEAQAAEFVDDLITALREQRRAIETPSPPDVEDVNSPSDEETDQEISGQYVIRIQDDARTLATFAADNQSDVMAEAIDYLIRDHDLIPKIEPLPYIPGREKAIINDEPSSPHDEEAMRAYRELTGGYYIDTHANKQGKKREIRRLAERCGCDVSFAGDW